VSSQSNSFSRLAAVTAAVIFGFSFIFTKDALDYLQPFQLMGIRFLVAAVLMTFLKLIGVLKISLRFNKIKTLLLVAFLQPVVYFICETIGVDLTSASESGIIISLVPIAITLLAVILLKEKLNWFQWVSIITSVAGVILIIIPNSNNQSNKAFYGLFFLIGAVLSAGLYNVFSKKVSINYTPAETTFVMMWVGALTFNAVGITQAIANNRFWEFFTELMNIHVVQDIAYLGILSSVIAFFLLNYSLSKLDASKVGVFMNITPIVSVIAGVFLRGENFYLIQCLGAAIILTGLWGVNRSSFIISKDKNINENQGHRA
jgi:drug/metabolite transporter (DMT)-like permease